MDDLNRYFAQQMKNPEFREEWERTHIVKYVYPANIHEEEGKFLVSVPDLKGCHTFGNSLDEAIEMARDAIAMWLCEAEDRNEEIPTATKHIDCRKGFISFIDVDTIEYRRTNDN
ncbi:type II toxin-antitoxin system HicB family antitoxin (plasmid) [Oscillospiraceae bacterium PP1C4]